jgi:hypothetical protein
MRFLEVFIVSGYMIALAPVFLLALAIPYAILRYRDAKSDRSDPQLGLKAGLYYFFSVGILLALAGLNILVVDLMVNPEGQGGPAGGGGVLGGPPAPARGLTQGQRTGLAMLLSGFLFTMLHLVLVKTMTRDRISPAPRRMFVGWRFAIIGMIMIIAFTGLLITLFQKDFGEKDARKTFFGTLVVWVPAWVVHLVLLAVYSRGMYEPDRLGRDWSSREPL